MLSFAITRDDIGNYVSALFLVYIPIIFVVPRVEHDVSLGLRLAYSRWW